MKLKYLLKILTTPSIWLRNHFTSRKVDRFYREVIENKDQIEVVYNDGFYLIFKFKERFFRSWIANKYYGFLSETWEVKPNVCRPEDCGLVDTIHHFTGMPSKITALEFDEIFLPKPKPAKPDDSWLTLEDPK